MNDNYPHKPIWILVARVEKHSHPGISCSGPRGLKKTGSRQLMPYVDLADGNSKVNQGSPKPVSVEDHTLYRIRYLRRPTQCMASVLVSNTTRQHNTLSTRWVNLTHRRTQHVSKILRSVMIHGRPPQHHHGGWRGLSAVSTRRSFPRRRATELDFGLPQLLRKFTYCATNTEQLPHNIPPFLPAFNSLLTLFPSPIPFSIPQVLAP